MTTIQRYTGFEFEVELLNLWNLELYMLLSFMEIRTVLLQILISFLLPLFLTLFLSFLLRITPFSLRHIFIQHFTESCSENKCCIWTEVTTMEVNQPLLILISFGSDSGEMKNLQKSSV